MSGILCLPLTTIQKMVPGCATVYSPRITVATEVVDCVSVWSLGCSISLPGRSSVGHVYMRAGNFSTVLQMVVTSLRITVPHLLRRLCMCRLLGTVPMLVRLRRTRCDVHYERSLRCRVLVCVYVCSLGVCAVRAVSVRRARTSVSHWYPPCQRSGVLLLFRQPHKVGCTFISSYHHISY